MGTLAQGFIFCPNFFFYLQGSEVTLVMLDNAFLGMHFHINYGVFLPFGSLNIGKEKH